MHQAPFLNSESIFSQIAAWTPCQYKFLVSQKLIYQAISRAGKRNLEYLGLRNLSSDLKWVSQNPVFMCVQGFAGSWILPFTSPNYSNAQNDLRISFAAKILYMNLWIWLLLIKHGQIIHTPI